jgi:hypothetical protein
MFKSNKHTELALSISLQSAFRFTLAFNDGCETSVDESLKGFSYWAKDLVICSEYHDNFEAFILQIFKSIKLNFCNVVFSTLDVIDKLQ